MKQVSSSSLTFNTLSPYDKYLTGPQTRASLAYHFGLAQTALAVAEEKATRLAYRVRLLELALARAARMHATGGFTFCRFCFLPNGDHAPDCFIGRALRSAVSERPGAREKRGSHG